MATLNVIYRIAADISSLESNVTKGVNTMNRMESVAGTVGRALAGAFTVTAVTQFVRQTIDAADRLERLSDTTGISVEALQDLEYVAQQSGNTLENVTGAITQMQRRLASGDDSAVAAVQRLGLSLTDLMRLSPDRQFIEIARAIGSIENPAQRMATAVAIFGRGAAQVMATLRADVDKVAESFEGMSRRSSKVLDEFGDKIQRWAAIVKARSADFIAAILDPVGAHEEAVRRMVAAQRLAERGGNAIPDAPARGADVSLLLSPSAASAEAVFNMLHGTPQQQAARFDRAADAAEKAAQWAKKASEAWHEMEVARFRMEEAAARTRWEEHQQAIADTVRLGFEMEKMYRANAAALGLFHRELSGIGVLMPAVNSLGAQTLGDQRGMLGKLGDFFKGGLSDLFGGAKSVGQGATNMLKGIGKGLFEGIGGGLLNMVSGLAMKGLGALGKQVGKLFGIDKEHEKVNDLRDAFEDTFGTLHDMNAAFHKVGLTVDRVLSAKKVKDFESAVAEFNRKLELQNTAWGKVQSAIERYGFTLEQLGPALQKQRLSETAVQLYEDFLLLTGAGMDVEATLRGMADKVNAFIHTAMEMGFVVDLSMKPILQKMIELGLLTDANGNLITDLESSGIQFSESITEAFGAVADSLREMVDLLRSFLGIANTPPNWNGWQPPNPGDIPALPNPGDIQAIPGFANGSGGFQDFGLGTLAMLHGREAVVPYGQSVGGGSVVNVYVSGSVVTERELADLVSARQDERLHLRRKLRAA